MSGLTGFGSAIVAQIIWSFLDMLIDLFPVGNFKMLMATLIFGDFVMTWMILASDWRHAKPKIAVYFIFAIPFLFLGNYILMTYPQDLLKNYLGLFFLNFSSYKIYLEIRNPSSPAADDASIHKTKKPLEVESLAPTSGDSDSENGDKNLTSSVELMQVSEPESCNLSIVKDEIEEEIVGEGFNELKSDSKRDYKGILIGIITGSLSGLLNGLFGMGGPPMILYFTAIDMNKSSIRATAALVNIFLFPVRLVALGIDGVIWDISWYWVISGLLATGIAFLCGNWLHHRADKTFIVRVLLILIFSSSFQFTRMADGSILGWISLANAIIIVFILFISILNEFRSLNSIKRPNSMSRMIV